MTIEYLAGFFDGEGSVRIKTSAGITRFQLQIGQKEEEVLFVIRDTFGGWIESGGINGVRKWVIGGKKAKALAKEMHPHLIVKRDSVGGFLL